MSLPAHSPQWDYSENARWHHYDLLSTGSTVVLLLLNVLRSSRAGTSYGTASTERALRLTQAAFTAAMMVHLMCLWLLLHRPQLHYHMRNPLICIRWLAVAGIILASMGLPVYQAGAASSSYCWLLRCVGMAFRTGLSFCVFAFAFYRMPWRYMAAVAFVYATCSSLTAPRFCRTAMAMHSTGHQPHADFSVLQGAAVVLDTLVGQGQQQQLLPQQGTGGPHLEAATDAGGDAESPWEATASLLLAACSADVVQDSPAKQQACNGALVGQCQATLWTLKFGVSYWMVLIMISLERYNKWRYLKQRQASNAANSGAGPALGPNPSQGPIGNPSSYSNQQGLLASHYQAPTAWAFLRVELLGLLVLADLPVLALYWILTLVMRPDVASLQALI